MPQVLMIEHFLPGNTYTYELVKELQKLVEVELLCRRDAGECPELRQKSPLLYPNGTGKLLAPLVYGYGLSCLSKRVTSSRYDMIHVQTFKKAEYEMPVYLHRNPRAALIHTVHNVLPHEAAEKDEALYSRFYGACDALITHNEYSRQLLSDRFSLPPEKIRVIPHGIYGSIRECPIRADKTRTNFLTFGMIRDYKGIDVLLKAIALLPRELRNRCSFTIAGRQYREQHDTDYEAMTAELGISDTVRFLLRQIRDEEIPGLFQQADACIFPYKQIYGSGALMMAYTYLRPVIVSNVPAFCEETGNGKTGLLFASEDPAALAGAILRFLETDEAGRRSFSENIRTLAETKYSFSRSAVLTAQLYEDVLRDRG